MCTPSSLNIHIIYIPSFNLHHTHMCLHTYTELYRNPHSHTYAPYTYAHPYILDWTIENCQYWTFLSMKAVLYHVFSNYVFSHFYLLIHTHSQCTFSFAQHESPLTKTYVDWLHGIPTSLTLHISDSGPDMSLPQHTLWKGCLAFPRPQKPRAVNERTPGTKSPGHCNQPISPSSRMNPEAVCRGASMRAKRLKPVQKVRHGLGSKGCNAVPQIPRTHYVPVTWAELCFPEFVYWRSNLKCNCIWKRVL